MSLRELRRAHKLTQERIAETLGIGQDQVIPAGTAQRSSAFHASQLRGSHGGRLTLVAEFPNHKPVALSGIAELGADAMSTAPRAQHAEVSAG